MLLNLLGASKRVVNIGLVVVIAFVSGCGGGNLFKTFASTDSDESLYRTAMDAINSANYQLAIDTCTLMDPVFASTPRSLYLCANAYAGLCGYTLFTVANQLSTFTNTPLLFQYFMQKNNGATAAKVAACGTALTKIRAIGTAANRTADHNYLAILSGLTNMGVILNYLADANTNDDGIPDAAWDSCNSAVDLLDADAMQFGTALWEIYRSVESTSSTLTNPLKTALDAVSAGIDAVDVTYNFLKATANPAAFTANQKKGIRTLIKEGSALGLAYCANFLVCKCP